MNQDSNTPAIQTPAPGGLGSPPLVRLRPDWDSAETFRLREWIEAGAHFGHLRRFRQPRMARWIHATVGGVDILDLSRLEGQLDDARVAIARALREGGPMLIVGDKPSRQGPALHLAEILGCGFCLGRWPAGLLTNAVAHLGALEAAALALAAGDPVPARRRDKLSRVKAPLGLALRPGLLIWLGGSEQPLREAQAMGWATVGVLDSNVDPSLIAHPVVCNDDGAKPLAMLARDLGGAFTRQDGSPIR